MSTPRRSRLWVGMAVVLGLVAVAVGGAMYLRETSQDRTVIRHAVAGRLHVDDDQVEVHRFVSHGSCYVAQVTVKTVGEPVYSVAVHKQRPSPAVTRISGDLLGSASDPAFDTDDPRWDPSCFTS